MICCVAVSSQLEELDERVAQVISSAWSDNTLAVRNSQWKRYFQFCHQFSLLPLPADVSTIARFLVHTGQNTRYVTVNNYMSALNSLHKFYGFDVDYRSYYLIKLILKGLKSMDEGSSSARIPFTIQQLDLMYARMNHDYYNETCWLAVIICVRTLLRKSNLLPSKTDDPHVMMRSDVEFFPDYLVFTVYSSKTRSKNDEPLKIPVRRIANSKFCVYSRLLSHFGHLSGSQDSPLLLKQTPSGVKPLMYHDVLKFLKGGAMSIGIDPKRIGLHSLRKTGAMHLYAIGIPLNDIRLVGDWRSMAVLVYLSAPFERLLDVEKQSADALEYYS